MNKTCGNCKRILAHTRFRYIQTNVDSLDHICLSCRAGRARRPSVEHVQSGEVWLADLVAQASQQFDPTTERIMFEELTYKLMLRTGYLNEWKLPVWLNGKMFAETET